MTIHNMPETYTNLIMTGFMGVGKTTVGKLLANQLNWPFVDVDHEIELKHGKAVTQIFTELGEPAFRQMEKQFTTALCKEANHQVISLGGGAFIQEEIRQACLAHGLVIYLDISWESWKLRLPYIQDSRPILQQKSLEEVEQLFNTRRSLYQDHHLCIQMDEIGFEEAAKQIISYLNSHKY